MVLRPSNYKKKQDQLFYFGAKRASKIYTKVPEVIEQPKNTNVVVSSVFHKIVGENIVDVERIVLPQGVQKIQEEAFKQLRITKSINLPTSVREIGENAFILAEDAYVLCEIGTFVIPIV